MNPSAESVTSVLARRAQLRELFASHQFDQLDLQLEEQANVWLDGSTLPFTYEWSVDDLLDPAVPPAETISHLQAWVTQRPDSYHAWLMTAIHWEEAAARIRTAYTCDCVSDDRWAGAQMARDLSLTALLHAMTLHARPAEALGRMFRMTCYLGEPDWLIALVMGEDPADCPTLQMQFDEDDWQGGLQRLYAEGATQLATIPASLPQYLPPRDGEQRYDNRSYWLQAKLNVRPQDSSIRSEWLYYCYPRWGGNHQWMREFIDGPQCEALSDAERNHLHITQASDYLGYSSLFPAASEHEDIAFCRNKFNELLALELLPGSRANLLRKYAIFVSHYARTQEGDDVHWDRAEMQLAYDLLVEAWQTGHPAHDPSALEQAFDVLICCVDFAGIEDRFGLFPLWLERSQLWGDNKYVVIIAALASQFGFYGIQQGQFDHEALFARAHRLTADIDFGQLGGNLFESVSEEAAAFLMHEMAEAGDISAMAGLTDYYRGLMSKRCGRDPETYKDIPLSRQWMAQAAEKGHLISRYNLVYFRINENEKLTDGEYQNARETLYSVLDEIDSSTEFWLRASRELAELMLFSGIESECRESLEVVLYNLWRDHRSFGRRLAAGYYAHAFHTGSGCTPNSYLAKVWIDRALEIEPDSEYLLDRAREIYGTGILGRWLVKRGFKRDEKRVDEFGHAVTFG